MKLCHAAIVIALSSALVMCHQEKLGNAHKEADNPTSLNNEPTFSEQDKDFVGPPSSLKNPEQDKDFVGPPSSLKNPEQITPVLVENSPPKTSMEQSRSESTYDPKKWRGMKGPVEVPLETQWAWIIGLCVLVAVFAAGIYRWWFHKPSGPVYIEAPHERALRELNELALRELPHKGLILDFYVLLSDTVRHYVEDRFGICAPEQTTKEFLNAARHHPQIIDDHQRLLASFLRAADMVKYAAQRPGPHECENGLDAARGFVRESAPTTAHDANATQSQVAHEAKNEPL